MILCFDRREHARETYSTSKEKFLTATKNSNAASVVT